jgi:hypothetical protein
MTANICGFSLSCDEFHFVAPSERLSAFRQSADFKEVVVTEKSEACLHLSVLKRDHEFASLRCEFGRQSQAQESTTAMVTKAVIQLSRVERDSGTRTVRSQKKATFKDDMLQSAE